MKQYMIKGYVQNKKRLIELNKIIQISRRNVDKLETVSILNVLDRYSQALDLLDDYDHQSLKKPKGSSSTYVIEYEEAINFIHQMKFHEKSDLFGLEKDGGFKSGLASIYQTYDGNDLIPTVEEKAATLLYALVKNHGFAGGNKRIATAIFIYFLDKNNILIQNNEFIIDNHTLVALTILIAESDPTEKEMMTNSVMNFLIK
ncbi:MAG: Fic family protein [Acholeplasma sp.]|nr:Fic family protein [Acholeplasma sp.]